MATQQEEQTHRSDPVTAPEGGPLTEANELLADDSGCIEEQRRVLRREQRELARALQEQIGGFDSSKACYEKNNQLFQNVSYSRELALDAENLDIFANKFVKEMEGRAQMTRFCEVRLIQKLKEKCSTAGSHDDHSIFDWKTLGAEAGICFNAIPSRVTFLSGQLQSGSTKKTRTRRKRYKADWEKESDGEEEIVCPQQFAPQEQQQKETNQRSKTDENRLHRMKKRLERKSKEAAAKRKSLFDSKFKAMGNNNPVRQKAEKDLVDHDQDIDAVEFLIDPLSFTRTIENIFNIAFLVKSGDAKMKLRQYSSTSKSSALESSHSDDSNTLELPKGWVLGATNNRGGGSNYLAGNRPTTDTQCVISFTMADWRRLRSSVKVKKEYDSSFNLTTDGMENGQWGLDEFFSQLPYVAV